MQVRDDRPNGPPGKPTNLGLSTIQSITTSATSTIISEASSTTDSGESTSTAASEQTTTSALLNSASITPVLGPNSALIASQTGTTAPTPTPTDQADSTANLGSDTGYYGRQMSNGAIAAAVVVPLLILALLAAVVLLCYRRRRQHADRATTFAQNMVQQPPQPIHEHYNLAPVAAGVPISGYYTGLDTSEAESSRNTVFSDEAPPPYGNKAAAVPLINAPPDQSDTRSLSSWRTAPHDTAYLGAADAEQRSISSTAYSDNASVHSARAARMSVGGAHVITTMASRDPFDDPDSPVSSVDGEEARALHGHALNRAISPISMSGRRLA